MSPGLERQIIRRLLILQVFLQALPELEGRHPQTPFGRVALIAPVLEGANVKVTPVLEGVIAKVDSTSVAVVIVASLLKVVDVKVEVLPVVVRLVA